MPPKVFTDGCVERELRVTEEGIITQRQRWKQGSLAILGGSFQTAAHAIRTRNGALLAMAIDTMVPPLTLHGAVATAAAALGAVLFLLGGISPIAPAIALSALALFAVAIMISWAAYGRHVLPIGLWPQMVKFALAKLKIYRGFGFKGTREWVRSDRSKGG